MRRGSTWTLTQMVILFLKNLNLSSLLNISVAFYLWSVQKSPAFSLISSVYINRVGKSMENEFVVWSLERNGFFLRKILGINRIIASQSKYSQWWIIPEPPFPHAVQGDRGLWGRDCTKLFCQYLGKYSYFDYLCYYTRDEQGFQELCGIVNQQWVHD